MFPGLHLINQKDLCILRDPLSTECQQNKLSLQLCISAFPHELFNPALRLKVILVSFCRLSNTMNVYQVTICLLFMILLYESSAEVSCKRLQFFFGHFDQHFYSSFLFFYSEGSRRELKEGVLPTLNLPAKSIENVVHCSH